MNTQSSYLKPQAAPKELKPTLSMHPQKFALWLFIVTVVMIFASFTSAYIVKQADGNWQIFEIPTRFAWSTGVILLSSVTLQWSYLAAKRNALTQNRIGLVLTFILGIAFLVMQLLGWQDLVAIEVFFTGGNAAGSFVYVLTAVHGVHLISGLIYLLVMVVKSFLYRVHSKNMLNMEMSTTYWHFLGGLWTYLYLFLLLNN